MEERETRETFVIEVGKSLLDGHLVSREVSWLQEIYTCAGQAALNDSNKNQDERATELLHALLDERNRVEGLSKLSKYGCLPVSLIPISLSLLTDESDITSTFFASDIRQFFVRERDEDPREERISEEGNEGAPSCTPFITPSPSPPPSVTTTPQKSQQLPRQKKQANPFSRLPDKLQKEIKQPPQPNQPLPNVPFLLIATLRSGSPDPKKHHSESSLYLQDSTGAIACNLANPDTSYLNNTLLITSWNYIPFVKGKLCCFFLF